MIQYLLLRDLFWDWEMGDGNVEGNEKLWRGYLRTKFLLKKAI
jgi:hypothetical protein